MKQKLLISLLIVLGVVSIVLWLLYFSPLFVEDRDECNKPYITLSFDDGYEDNYLNAFPLMENYQYDGVSSVISGLIGDTFENQELMSFIQLNELRDSGWEIASHSIIHKNLTELNQEDLSTDLQQSKIILENNGFEIRSFTVPFGYYNGQIREEAMKLYESTRSSNWGTNYFSDLDVYDLRSKWMVNTTSIAEIKSWIEEAENSNGWLIIMHHHIRDDLDREYTLSTNNLGIILQYIDEKNIEVKTISQILDLGCHK